MTILVTGGRGSIGREVVAGLVAAGQRVRVSSRRPGSAAAPPGVEVVGADLSDPAAFPALLRGVRRVFLYAHADRADAFAEQARRAGVEHVVLLSSNSVLFPDAAENPTAVEHLRVEQALRDSGLGWTFVRPGYLATNTRRWQASIRQERVVRTAFPDGSTPLVHERDPAEVAVRALLDDAHRFRAHLVLGGAALTEREQVAAIADALGEPVVLDVLGLDAYRQELLDRVPEVFVEPILRSRGLVPEVPAAVRHDATAEVLGRPPLPFAVWARDHADDFR